MTRNKVKEITVKYRLETTTCKCCQQKLEKPKHRDLEFTFTKDSFFKWLDEDSWKITATCKDELNYTVEEFCYETITFFSTFSGETVYVDQVELDNLRQFALDNVV